MIEVVSLPALATVQDLGRHGHWAEGLGSAGTMDPLGHCLANWLLGNADDDATLEIPLTPGRFRIIEDTGFAIAGAACGATLDGIALPRCFAGTARAGQILEFGAMRDGARVYLALPGGIDVPEILGSRSTQLREAFGGLDGRALKPGDRLRGRTPTYSVCDISFNLPPLRQAGETEIRLRVIASAETNEFTEAALKAFHGEAFKVTPQSNRQGYRLEGPILERWTEGELRSHGIAPGIIQVPASGQPIIQLADAATMGGYPKIGCVIDADLWRVAQARPGDLIRFEPLTFDAMRKAEEAFAAFLEEARQQLTAGRRLFQSWS
ncbi:5-oxoprolinase subunit C family protein [Martelella sp. AMO21009]